MSIDQGAVNSAYVFAVILALLWRNRAWHILLYAATAGIVMSHWKWLTIPAAFVLICILGLHVAARRPAGRNAVLWITSGLLLVGWAVLKYPAIRTALPTPSGIDLPFVVGLSYLVLKLVHVAVDAMRPRAKPVRASTLIAMSFFPPTLAAGPMHRYEEFAAEFDAPARAKDWMLVARRIITGLFKMAVLGHHLSTRLATGVLASPGDYGTLRLWLAVYAYSLYIYFNFSGMTDMAIGIGEAFGIRVPENFRAPYLKLDIQQFWQNWHITLTRWLQAYLFMPLSKRLMKTRLRSKPRLIAGIGYIVTFLFCGLWHGEGWNFILWGLYHGIGLCLYAQLPTHLKAPVGEAATRLSWRGALWWAITFHFVTIGWVLFACPLPEAGQALARMFGLG